MNPLTKAQLIVESAEGLLDVFAVQFNPTEFTLDKDVQLQDIGIPGLDSPLVQFVRGNAEKLSVDLYFDTTDAGTGSITVPVTVFTDRIYSLVKIEPERHAPPIVTFIWGPAFPGVLLSPTTGNQRRHAFRGVVQSVRQKFTFFSPDGIPLRATLTLSIREYKTLDEQMAQLNLSSPDRTHSHVTSEGDTLARVADRYYKRSSEWRAIAVENEIDDPRRLEVGRFLTVPSIR